MLSYVEYLGRLFYPVHLAVPYPHRDTHLPVWEVLGAAVLLAGVTAAAVAAWRKYPYGTVGWLWYLGMMVPVIGLIELGAEAEPDRFTYLPQIGIGMALAWGIADASRRWPYQRTICGLASAVVLLALAACAWRQTSYWRNSKTLWDHALLCTSRNAIAHGNLGLFLAGQGRRDEAIAQYREALEINPDYVQAHGNLGAALAQQGRVDEAIAEYRELLKISPRDAEAYCNLGLALASAGRLDEAAAEYREAIKIDPNEAVAHGALGIALASVGRLDEAVAEYESALKINPNDAIAQRNLAWIRATHPDPRFRDGAEALTLARRRPDLAQRSHRAGHAGRRLRRGGPLSRGRADRPASHPVGCCRRQPPACRADRCLPGALQEGKTLSSTAGPPSP